MNVEERAAGGGGGGAVPYAVVASNLSTQYGIHELAGELGYDGRPGWANPSYVTAVEAATLIKVGPSMTGGSYHKQRGGAETIASACIKVYQNITNGGAGMLDAANRGGGAAIMALFGSKEAFMRTVGTASAGYTIIFGVPQMPWLTSMLSSAISSTPTALLTMATNFVGGLFNAATIAALGAAGIAVVVAFTVSVLALRSANNAAFRFLGFASSGGAGAVVASDAKLEALVEKIPEEVLPGMPPAGGSVPEAASAALAVAVDPRARAVDPPAGLKFSVNGMIISGPNAKTIATQFAGLGGIRAIKVVVDHTTRPMTLRDATEANLRGGYRKTRRSSHRKHNGSRKHRSRRHRRSAHRKSRRQH